MMRKFSVLAKLGGPLCHVIPPLMFLFLLSSVAAPQAGAAILISEETADDLTVRWYLVHDGIIHKIYDLEVQNLDAVARTVWLDTFFSDASFPIDQLQNIQFYELKALPENVTVYDYDWVEYPVYEDNILVGYENRWEVVGSHLVEGTKCQWKPSKMQWFVRTSTTYKESMGYITLPKFGSKTQYDNFGQVETDNGTKRFKLEFDVPVQSRASGWGSAGSVALLLDGLEFHPWWSGSWLYRIPLTLGIGENVPPENHQYRVVLDKVDNLSSHCLDNFQDLRFLEDEDTGELDFWLENYISGDNVIVWFERAENALTDNVAYCYYGNAGAGPAENADATFLFYDDFSGTLSDKWNAYGTATIEAGTLKITGTTAWDANGVTAKATLARPVIITWEENHPLPASQAVMSGYGASTLSIATGCFIYGNNPSIYAYISGSQTDTGYDFAAGVWMDWRVDMGPPNAYEFYYEGGSVYTNTDYATDDQTVQFQIYNSVSVYYDNVIVREYVAPEPTVTAGAEETPPPTGNVWVEGIGCNNDLVDRAANLAWSSPVLATQINATVSDNQVGRDGMTMENVFLWVYDAVSGTVVDNVNPTSYENVDENTKKFYFDSYDPADAMGDASLGVFSAFCEAYDSVGNYDNLDDSDVFTVDDLDDSVVPSQENLAGHQHRIYGTTARETGGSVTLTDGRRVDSNDGTANATVSGADFENTWASSAAGNVYFELTTAELDGPTDNLYYVSPNVAPEIVSAIPSEGLVDRKQDYAGSGAALTTTITVRIRDNDGRADLSAAWVAIRDNNDMIQENENVWASRVVVDADQYDVSLSYNPPDNFADDNLGAFDVWGYAADVYDAEDSGWDISTFTVDDRYSSITFDPTSPYLGWPLNVSGTHFRVVGSSSVTGSWLIDNRHGQFSLGASDSYDYSYTIDAASLSDNVSVTIRSFDGSLDGVSASSYLVNENVQYQISVRFEENYELVGWIPDENRAMDMLFEWDGGTHPYTLTANPENIVVPATGAETRIVKLTDNDDYWRYVIPEYPGGNLDFVIVDDIIDVEQYRFYLQDYTGLYIPPDGQLLVRFWIGTNLAEINSDFWGADWRNTAWLVTGTQYQIWVRGVDAPLRMVGPIDAVVPSEEKTIIVQSVISELDPIYDYVYWAAWRVDNNTIRVEYQDNLDNTVTAHVGIYDMDGNLVVEYQPDNEWFIITWVGAEGAESYEVVLTVLHDVYGSFTMSMPIDLMDGPPGVEGTGNPFDLPAGLTLAALGSLILVLIVGLSFDALRVQMGMLAMALTVVFCWNMGFLPLPGPWDGAFTATLILVTAVLFALTWRRGK